MKVNQNLIDVEYTEGDLVYLAVTDLLTRYSFHAASYFVSIYTPPTNATVAEQIRHQNTFWRHQLSKIHNSDTARISLTDYTEFDAWIQNFERNVAPLVSQNNLPSARVASRLIDFCAPMLEPVGVPVGV